jgi:lipid II:glycine glycyltransferase (peptidoglycan interpeptide bridge formation enzyme)
MLLASYKNIKYHRFLSDSFSEEDNSHLLNNFDYSFVISYGDFKSTSYDIVDKHAVIIDLEKNIDEVFSNFNSTSRKHIRRFDKLEELSFHNEIYDKSTFYKFYCSCERSRDWLPIAEEEFFNSIIFYVTYMGIPISGISAYICDSKIRMGRIFSIRNKTKIDNANLIFGVAAKKLVYEFCIYAKENNFKFIDLGGIDLKSDKKSGISKFKLSFTDKIVPVKIGRYVKPPKTYFELNSTFKKEGFDIT